MLYLKKNTWRYHYFTPVYQKSWWYDLQFLRYGVRQSVTNWWLWSIFCPFTPPPPTVLLKTQDIRILKKWKQLLEISSFYTSVPKTTITWGMVPEMWSETYRIFCYFGPFFALFPLPPPRKKTTQKIKILKTPKRYLEKSLFCTCVPKNHNHIMYA